MAIHTGGVRMDEKLPPHIIGPAPKEERMICVDCGMACTDVPICNNCNEARAARFARITALRAVYEKAYFAALTGCAMSGSPELTRDWCHRIALETVRQWTAMQAELDALIGEMG